MLSFMWVKEGYRRQWGGGRGRAPGRAGWLGRRVIVGLMVAALAMIGLTGVRGAQAEDEVVQDGVPALSAAVAETAARAAQHFAAKEYQELWEMAAPLLQDKITVAQLQAIGDQLGAAQAVGQPQAVPGYPRTAIVVLTYPAVTIDLIVTVDEQGKLIGLFVGPHREQAPPSPPPSGSQEPAGSQQQQHSQQQAQQTTAEWPPYAVSGTFAERTTTFGTPGWELGGTFTYPTGRHEYPAVVLVHGSGPHDRDETIGPNHIFRDLAWGLASRGIAVFRYDKRTYVYGAKMTAAEISPDSEVIDDARAAIAWVGQQPGVTRVYLVGHSLGAQLAPAIAEGLPASTLAGLILLAAPVRPLEQLVVDQTQYLAQVDGTVTDEEEQAIAQLQMAVQALAGGQLPADVDFLGAPVHYWLQLHQLAPVPIARRLDFPMLLLQGGRDYQVPPSEFEQWQKGLNGKAQVSFKLLPNLNHLFMPGSGPSTPQEYEKPGHVSVEVIDAIAQFIEPGNQG
ncbi:MAG: alpha/beta fold hydrolase [Limnochordaceae bacterium]|nr:alpha/beta fold hydrolase [Limnochordaceae bacterium]